MRPRKFALAVPLRKVARCACSRAVKGISQNFSHYSGPLTVVNTYSDNFREISLRALACSPGIILSIAVCSRREPLLLRSIQVLHSVSRNSKYDSRQRSCRLISFRFDELMSGSGKHGKLIYLFLNAFNINDIFTALSATRFEADFSSLSETLLKRPCSLLGDITFS